MKAKIIWHLPDEKFLLLVLASTMLTGVAHVSIYQWPYFQLGAQDRKITTMHRVVMLAPGNTEWGDNGWDGHWVGGRGRTIWRIRFEGWAYSFLVAESRACHSLLILKFSVLLMCQRVERSSDDPLRSLWMRERTKALNVLPKGLSSYKLMCQERFGSFWVERWWVRETEAEKEHRFQAIQTSALLVNDSRSVTDNVNITKIQLCCRTLDFWNKTQNRNECVFCCNNWFEVHAPSSFSRAPSTPAII